jgi:hypothetical protein
MVTTRARRKEERTSSQLDSVPAPPQLAPEVGWRTLPRQSVMRSQHDSTWMYTAIGAWNDAWRNHGGYPRKERRW